MIEKRSIPLAILFTIITCGIYWFYWEYKLIDTMYRVNNKPSTAGVDLLLGIVTCGIYSIYMMYKMGKLETEAHVLYNLNEKDEALLYVILSIFSFGIISFAILQSNINNQLADAANGAYNDPQRNPYQ